MPWLAPQLPLAVPEPQIAQAEPLVVRHALVTGEPIDNLSRVAPGSFTPRLPRNGT
jgi:hypothetical protein